MGLLGAQKNFDFFCNVWVVNRVREREVNNVSVSRHGPVKEVVNLLGLGHLVRHNLDVVCVLAGRNVDQGPVMVTVPQILEGLSGFI